MTTFYHGTRAGFKRGGVLLPRSVTGRPETPGMKRAIGDEGDYVYVTTEWDIAEAVAVVSLGRGRPKVLTVQPVGPLQKDPALFNGEDRETYRCDSAKVLRVEYVDPVEFLEKLSAKD